MHVIGVDITSHSLRYIKMVTELELQGVYSAHIIPLLCSGQQASGS